MTDHSKDSLPTTRRGSFGRRAWMPVAASRFLFLGAFVWAIGVIVFIVVKAG